MNAAAQPSQELFLGRQPILDRGQNLAAFELLFRSGHVGGAMVDDDVVATATVINHAFTELGVETVLGRHQGFINLSAPLIMSDVIELLPKGKVVLEILETVKVSPQLLERCSSLKAAGFTLALDDFEGNEEEFGPLLDIVDIVKVDVQHLDTAALERITARMKQRRLRLLAEKVDNRETFDQCLALGYELFQGYYFAKPTIITGRRLSHAETALMRLLGLVLGDAETASIEAVFKQNPDLSINLLKLVNSVAVGGVGGRIESLRQGITLLGRKQLQRWLQLLLFTLSSAPNADFPSPLLLLAATRGKLMELIAHALNPRDRDRQDRAFMTGILSLVTALLGMPLSEVVGNVAMAADVKAALLERSGELGDMLNLVECLELSDVPAIEAVLSRLAALDHGALMGLQVEAMGWANQIGETQAR